MARVKFPLEMADGAMVRDMEELKAHFDTEKIIEHFMSGRLLAWLKVRGYDEEAEKVGALASEDPELAKKLCEIFGQEYGGGVDRLAVERRLKKKARLRQITDSDEIIDNVDSAAFNQEELDELYDRGAEKIYLCEGSFIIPKSKQDVEYVLLAGAKAEGLATAEDIEFAELILGKLFKLPRPKLATAEDIEIAELENELEKYGSEPDKAHKAHDDLHKTLAGIKNAIANDYLTSVNINLPQGDAYYRCPAVVYSGYGHNIVYSDKNGEIFYRVDSGHKRRPEYNYHIRLGKIIDIAGDFCLDDEGVLYYTNSSSLHATVSDIPKIKQICQTRYNDYLLLDERGRVFRMRNEDYHSNLPLGSPVATKVRISVKSTKDAPPIKQVAGSISASMEYALDENGVLHIIKNCSYGIIFFRDGKSKTMSGKEFPAYIRQLPPIRKISCSGKATFALGEDGSVCFWSDFEDEKKLSALKSFRLSVGDGRIVDIGGLHISLDETLYGIPLLDTDGKVHCFGNEEYILKYDPKYAKLPVMKRLFWKDKDLLGTDENNVLYGVEGGIKYEQRNGERLPMPIQVYCE